MITAPDKATKEAAIKQLLSNLHKIRPEQLDLKLQEMLGQTPDQQEK